MPSLMMSGVIAAIKAPEPGPSHKSTTHEERFVHFTNLEHPKFKGATLFARKEGPDMWAYAIAFCSKEDQFNKKIGRTVARRRYFVERDTAGLSLLTLGDFSYDCAKVRLNERLDALAGKQCQP